jgi:hypothetical protein
METIFDAQPTRENRIAVNIVSIQWNRFIFRCVLVRFYFIFSLKFALTLNIKQSNLVNLWRLFYVFFSFIDIFACLVLGLFPFCVVSCLNSNLVIVNKILLLYTISLLAELMMRNCLQLLLMVGKFGHGCALFK